MFLCKDCDYVFDEPLTGTTYSDTDTPYGYPTTEELCPKCGSDDIAKAVECAYCGGFVAEKKDDEYVKFSNGDIVCNGCLHDYCKEVYA